MSTPIFLVADLGHRGSKQHGGPAKHTWHHQYQGSPITTTALHASAAWEGPGRGADSTECKLIPQSPAALH